jgi:hypothetical protein
VREGDRGGRPEWVARASIAVAAASNSALVMALSFAVSTRIVIMIEPSTERNVSIGDVCRPRPGDWALPSVRAVACAMAGHERHHLADFRRQQGA